MAGPSSISCVAIPRRRTEAWTISNALGREKGAGLKGKIARDGQIRATGFRAGELKLNIVGVKGFVGQHGSRGNRQGGVEHDRIRHSLSDHGLIREGIGGGKEDRTFRNDDTGTTAGGIGDGITADRGAVCQIENGSRSHFQDTEVGHHNQIEPKHVACHKHSGARGISDIITLIFDDEVTIDVVGPFDPDRTGAADFVGVGGATPGGQGDTARRGAPRQLDCDASASALSRATVLSAAAHRRDDSGSLQRGGNEPDRAAGSTSRRDGSGIRSGGVGVNLTIQKG